jgi:hypothetical protein
LNFLGFLFREHAGNNVLLSNPNHFADGTGCCRVVTGYYPDVYASVLKSLDNGRSFWTK